MLRSCSRSVMTSIVYVLLPALWQSCALRLRFLVLRFYCLIMSSLLVSPYFFFFNDTATPEIYTLSLHDALPISAHGDRRGHLDIGSRARDRDSRDHRDDLHRDASGADRDRPGARRRRGRAAGAVLRAQIGRAHV